MTKKRISLLIVAVLSVALSACVTQEFDNDETPVVKNQANRDDMAATRISLGLGYLRMGNMAQAKQNLEKAKKFSPEMVQVYTAFAHYYETVGENELTIASFEEALSLKSDDADTLNNYGVYLCRQDQIEAAEKQLLKAIAVPSYILVAKSYENLSSCFLQKDNFVKAEAYLHKAIMHSPGNASTIFQMVRLQYALGEYTQAKSYEQRFEKVTRRFSPQSLALAYKVYLKLEEHRTAENYGTMLVKMYPQSWEAQQYLLNELELIEADTLAKRYKLTQISETATKSKKRVVKLSPKKALSSNSANSSSIVESEVANQKVLQATTAPAFTTTNITTNTTMSPSSISAASSASINAALTMKSVETAPPVSEQTPVTVSKLPDNPSIQDKRVVVLVTAKTAENNITKIAENKIIEKSNKVLINNKTGVLALAEKETPFEDQEIFQIAEKPVHIIEDAPTVEEPLTTDSTKTQQSGVVSNKPPKIHVVSAGDNLYAISMKYNIKIKALRRWNNITDNHKIRINDKLHLIDPKTVTE
ncbi:MAG: type IV pilus biogenesis/stability protein PilW [Colwellia sp.]|nr:type IV pilus biogenesis/stability protein PilW [Colwellia sp.]